MATNKPAFLFIATHSVDTRLGEILSFIWANYAGLREFWWQVRGFCNEFPEISLKDVEKKFLSGLPLPGGIDFKSMFISKEWDRHEQEFARWLIFDTCTLYEGWAENVCLEVFGDQEAGKFAKALQFPEGVDDKGRVTGYPKAITSANSSRSALMHTQFFPTIKASPFNQWASVDSLLIAYRYFKECRNCFIHSDGMATAETVDTRAALWSEQTKVPLAGSLPPFAHEFQLPWQTIGSKIRLNLMDCISFTALVRKLIYTFDAALCVTQTSENLVEKRLKKLTATEPKWAHMPSDPIKLERRIQRLLAAARIPNPVNINNIVLWMQGKKII